MKNFKIKLIYKQHQKFKTDAKEKHKNCKNKDATIFELVITKLDSCSL